MRLTLTAFGKTQTYTEWAIELHINRSTIRSRIDKWGLADHERILKSTHVMHKGSEDYEKCVECGVLSSFTMRKICLKCH